MLLNKQVSSLLGLCARARKVVSGETVIESIRNQEAHLVLYASDASNNTKKRIQDKARFYGFDAIEVEDSTQLSNAIGKSGRMAVAIVDAGFAKNIKEKLGVGDEDGKNE